MWKHDNYFYFVNYQIIPNFVCLLFWSQRSYEKSTFLSKICKSCSCETRRWSFISTIFYWSKDWLSYSRWSSSSLYTIFQRFSKEYNISISIEWNLLLKWKTTSLCCKRCTFRLVYRKVNVNLITFSKGLVTRHQSFKTYITSKPNSVNGTKIKEII